MPQSNPSQKEIELTKNIRSAIKQNELENVFKAAGASKITGQANEVLGETTAAQIAPLITQGNFQPPSGAQAPEPKLVQAAQSAFEPSKLNEAFKNAGVDPEQGQEVASREMARIAQGASDFARAENRAVCHNCTAIGAARAATQLGPQLATQ